MKLNINKTLSGIILFLTFFSLNSFAQLTVSILGATGVCSGDSTTLTVDISGGTIPYTFTWSNGLGKGQTKTVSPSITTTYHVTVTDASSNTAVDSLNFFVASIPKVDAGNDTTICKGANVNLNALGSEKVVVYYWNIEVENQSLNISPSITTTYTVTATDFSGCSNSDEVVVYVGNCYILKDTIVAPVSGGSLKDSIFLSIKDSCVFDYSQPIDTFYIASSFVNSSKIYFNWIFKQGSNTFNLTSDIEINKVALGYDLIYFTIQCNETKKKGLQSNTFAAPYTITALSVENLKQNNFDVELFPNPAQDFVKIKTTGLSNEKIDFKIYTIANQLIFADKMNANSVYDLNVSGFAKGIYFVKLVNSGNTTVQKFIVK